MLTAYKRCHWFNSDFHSGFVLNDNQKISEISFDVNPFQIDVNNNLKVITYVRDATQSKPIQIKLKLPYNQSREVFNDDNEAFPIIYTNHTGTEGMSTYYPYSIARLVPQQIPRFTFRVDDNYNQFIGNSYITSLTNGDVLPVAMGVPTEKFIIFKSSGSFTLTDKMIVDILVVGGGGAGGSRSGGGGGAGAVIYLTNQTLTAGSYSITIGAGGTGSQSFVVNDNSMQGKDTSISFQGTNIYLAKGGGRGDGENGRGTTGGSGGGAYSSQTGLAAVNTNIPSGTYGNSGGNGTGGGGEASYTGGGGGGAAQAGQNATLSSGIGSAGNGGAGREIFITGISQFYGGGGGGGSGIGATRAGTGGTGGGGNGTLSNVNATNGLPNTGSGGGGSGFSGGNNGRSGDGGSGVVIIRYREQRNRIEGITPEETLIQTTNTNIPITIDSQYQINYQTPEVLSKGTYSATFAGGAISLKSSKSYPILNTNPLVWYRFDDQGNLGFDSMGIHNLSNPNGTSFSTDSISGIGSASFDGTNDSLDNNATFNLNSKDFSISVWMKKTDNSRTDWVLTLGGDSTTFYTLLEVGYIGSNKLRMGFFGNDLDTTGTYNDAGVWTHLVFTYKTGTRNRKIYRNGVEVGSDTAGAELNTNSTLRVGRKFTTEYSKCLMDDLRIYQDKVLTPVEIYDLYNGNSDRSYPILKDTNGVTINPLNWYKFDTGSLLMDSGTSKADLIAINTSPIADTNNFIKGTSSCLSIRNTTTGNYLTSVVNLTTPFTVSFWFNIDNANNNSPFGLGADDTSPAISCTYNSSTNKIVTYLATPNTWNTILTSTANININTWYHYTLTISNANPVLSTLYINGVLDTSGSGVSTFSTNNKNLRINIRGDLAAVDSFGGYIDDFRIYSQVLTATQVSELYTGRLAIYNPPGFILGTEIEPEV